MDTATNSVVVRRPRRRRPVRRYSEELHIFMFRFPLMAHTRCMRPCWCGAG